MVTPGLRDNALLYFGTQRYIGGEFDGVIFESVESRSVRCVGIDPGLLTRTVA